MNSTMTEKLKQSLLNNNFEEAAKAFYELSFDAACGTIIRLGYATERVSLYTFVVSLLLKNETAELHNLASEVLRLTLFFIKGAYVAGLYHARKSIELEPDNITYKKYLLFYYNTPDQVLSREEATQLAKKIREEQYEAQYAFRIESGQV